MRLKEIEKELKRLLSLSYGNVTQSKPIPGTKRRHAPLDSAAKTVKIVVTHETGYEKRYTLTPSMAAIAQPLGRKSWRSFAYNAYENDTIRQYMVKRLLKGLNREIVSLLSNSTLITTDCNIALKQFDWGSLHNTIKSTAPLLHAFLETCIPQCSSMKQCAIVMCTVILLKTHRRNTVVQAMISILMHAGHTAKQVYSRLQKLGICLSSTATWALIDNMGQDHDTSVKQWMESLKKTICTDDHGTAVIVPYNASSSFTKPSDDDEVFNSLSKYNVTASLDCSSQNSLSSPEVLSLSITKEGIVPYNAPSCSTEPSEDDEVSNSSSKHNVIAPLDCSSQNSLSSPEVSSLSNTEEGIFDAPMDCSTPICAVNSEVLDIDVSSVSDPATASSMDHISSDCTLSLLQSGDEGVSIDTDEWCGFRLVGDNIDKTVGPRFMRHNHQSQSLHYFNVYAVKDRVDLHHLSPNISMIDLQDVDVNRFLPSEDDYAALISNFQFLIAKVMAKCVPGLVHLSPLLPGHIQHIHSKAMSMKSEVVPLGVILKDENKLDDMVQIMDELHKYVPSIRSVENFEDENGDMLTMDIHHFSHILLSGDQLTTARAIGSQRIRKNSVDAVARLQGFIPVTEDWHTKVCYMKVYSRRHPLGFYPNSHLTIASVMVGTQADPMIASAYHWSLLAR
eukprot:Em0001g3037a